MTGRKNKVYWFSLLLIPILLLTACGPDDPPGTPDEYNVGCSESELISAINQANSDLGLSVINLEYCIYTLTEVDNTTTFDGTDIHNGLPVITTEITINGNSAVIEILPDPGEPNFGHFSLGANGDLELHDLEIRDGIRPVGGAVLNKYGDFLASGVEFVNNAAVGDGSNLPAMGGAIYSENGQVWVDDSVFQDNNAGVASGGPAKLGGAIYNKDGPLEVSDSTFRSNQAAGNGGAIYAEKFSGYTGPGTITIEGTDFYENEAVRGGAVFLLKERRGVFFNYAFFELNEAGNSGGALYSEDSGVSVLNSDFEDNIAFHGGAIYSKRSAEGVLSQMRIQLSELHRNWADRNGGAIFSENSDLTILDSTLTWNRGESCAGIQTGGTPGLNPRFGELNTAPRIGSTSQISNSTFEWNKTDRDSRSHGGAICHMMGDLKISGSYFMGNEGGLYGGGLLILDDLEMIDTRFEYNSASRGGGMAVGVVLEDNQWYSGINVEITGSRFYGNLATNKYYDNDGYGGGLLFYAEGTTIINKSTFERNGATNGGGGIFQAVGDLYLTNSTLSSNHGEGGGLKVYGGWQPVNTGLHHVTVAFSGGAGIKTSEFVNLSLYKSLFHNGVDVDLSAGTSLNVAGNVINNGPPALGTKFPPGSPMIGPLTGSTHPVLPGSPLIDFLSSCGEPDDQRSVLRPQGVGCEPGAYEYNGEDDIKADIPDFPVFEEDLGDSSDNCNPFAGLDPSLHTLGLPENTMNLPVVVRVEGVFPGLDAEGNSLSEFNATLGDLQAYQCSSQGFPDRMICMFNTPDHAPGMVLDFALYLDDCGDPVFFQPLVGIPEPQQGDTDRPVCSIDLGPGDCEAAGGHMSSGSPSTKPICVCP